MAKPDSGTTGNENGGRVSSIHYAEPVPRNARLSHLKARRGTPSLHNELAVECLDLVQGTGIVYLLDTTEYSMENGTSRLNFNDRDWEIPTQQTIVSVQHVNLIQLRTNGCCSVHTTSTVAISKPRKRRTNHVVVLGTDDCTSRIITAGVWIVDVETLISLNCH